MKDAGIDFAAYFAVGSDGDAAVEMGMRVDPAVGSDVGWSFDQDVGGDNGVVVNENRPGCRVKNC